MEIRRSKVFAKLDTMRRILIIDGGYTSSNITDFKNWTLIDEGIGDKYNLCQTAYFPAGYLTSDGIPLYKWDGVNVIPRAEAEIQADREALPPAQPSQLDRLEAQTTYTAMMTDTMLEV